MARPIFRSLYNLNTLYRSFHKLSYTLFSLSSRRFNLTAIIWQSDHIPFLSNLFQVCFFFRMTLYHFGNCLALSYIPFWIVYKYCGLSEYGAFWKCVQAGGVYALTQLGKMLLLATFFPTSGDYLQDDPDNFSPLQELLKCTVDLIDLIGLSVVMSRIAGKGHTKVLIAGLGWAGAELVLSRLLELWVGARGTEFDWKYIQKSFEANISIVHFLSVTALVWLHSRHDLPKQLVPAVVILIGFHSYKSVICDMISHVLHMYSWSLLAFKAAFSVTMALIVLHIYGGVASLAA